MLKKLFRITQCLIKINCSVNCQFFMQMIILVEFQNISELLKFINKNRLDETFSEVSKLLEIVLVTPILTSDSERSFSTMKLIKTFLRNTMSQNRLNSLVCLSIHKEYISKIRDYNNKVISIFAQIKD